MFFFAAVKSDLTKRITREEGVKNYLFAYEKSEGIFKLNEDVLLNPDCIVMVDSGAYELWSRGKGEEVNRQEYGEFCQRLAERVKCHIIFVNADVIPGRPPKKRKGQKKKGGGFVSAREREKSARTGWANYLFLRDEMGINVMPVFHQFESFKWLQKMAAETDYIGISPSNLRGFPTERKRRWLENVFEMLPPHYRTHAFGCTAPELLMDFPFYSADSSTWMNSQRFGALTVFDEKTFSMSHPGHECSHGNSVEYEECGVRNNVQQFLRFEREFDYLWHSSHPENIVRYFKELVMKTGRRGSTSVELNARKLMSLKEAELKVFLLRAHIFAVRSRSTRPGRLRSWADLTD